MAAQLEFKRRVRMPDFGEPPMPRPRRSGALAYGTLVWVGCVAAAWGVSAGTFPVGRWLDAAAAPIRVATQAPRPTRGSDLPVAAFAAPEPEPAKPTPTAAPEPEPEPEPAAEPPPDNVPAPVAADLPPAEPAARNADKPVREPPIATSRRALPEPDEPPEPRAAPTPPEPPSKTETNPASTRGTSCEAALAAYNEEIGIGKNRGPADLGADDFGRVLNNGGWFSACPVSERAGIDVCVAVQNGRAKGVTVRVSPRNAGAERCIARAAWGLSFPAHPKLDVARTHFAAE